MSNELSSRTMTEIVASNTSISDETVDNASSGQGVFYTIGEVTTGGNTEVTEVDRLIWAYCSPPIFVIGIVGNLLTVFVTGRHPTRTTSSGVYLITMSLAAIGVYLVGFLSQWLRACRFVDLTELGAWWCRFNKFFYYSFGDIAIWTLTLLTLDRLVAVCYPLRKVDFCTHRRAVMLCAVVAGLAVAKNFHMFWTRGTENKKGKVTNCGAPAPHTYFENYVRPWIVFVFVTLLPIAVILVCNVLVIRVLARSRNIRSSVGGGKVGKSQKKRRSRMTTMMCLAASFSFIFFTAPSIILVVLQPYYPGVSYDIAKAVNNLLVHVNYAANFFLYCLGGRSFRLRLKVMLRSLCSKKAHLELHPFFSLTQQRRSAVTLLESSKSSRSSSFMPSSRSSSSVTSSVRL